MSISKAVDLSGKVCVITGASSGIGKATALGLANLGATVVTVMRKRSPKADAALTEIKKPGSDRVTALYADLSLQRSVRQLAAEFDKKFDRLDVLINNAAVSIPKRRITEEGFENTFAVNVLAPFLLTQLLLPKLISSAPSRIVNVSSESARGNSVDFENLQGEKKYRMLGAYGQSKLELDLLTLEFARRLEGTRVTANFLHPGVVRTNLAHDLNPIARAVFWFFKLFFASPQKGARTSIYLASSPDVETLSGRYFSSNMKERRAPEESYDEMTASKLWCVCEELTGVRSTSLQAKSSTRPQS
ncbi:MAG TPA: SDR family oxidoreductase [Nitrososphaerales archaeon]|nr:SDR family oxidoreductase [Nitrososphaerales archaeon]